MYQSNVQDMVRRTVEAVEEAEAVEDAIDKTPCVFIAFEEPNDFVTYDEQQGVLQGAFAAADAYCERNGGWAHFGQRCELSQVTGGWVLFFGSLDMLHEWLASMLEYMFNKGAVCSLSYYPTMATVMWPYPVLKGQEATKVVIVGESGGSRPAESIRTWSCHLISLLLDRLMPGQEIVYRVTSPFGRGIPAENALQFIFDADWNISIMIHDVRRKAFVSFWAMSDNSIELNVWCERYGSAELARLAREIMCNSAVPIEEAWITDDVVYIGPPFDLEEARQMTLSECVTDIAELPPHGVVKVTQQGGEVCFQTALSAPD